MKRRVDDSERSDVAPGLVGEFFDGADPGHREPDIRRRLRIDVDERVEIEGRAAARTRELGLLAQDLDRWQRKKRRRGWHSAPAKRTRRSSHDGTRPEQGAQAGQASHRVRDNDSGQAVSLATRASEEAHGDQHSYRMGPGPARIAAKYVFDQVVARIRRDKCRLPPTIQRNLQISRRKRYEARTLP